MKNAIKPRKTRKIYFKCCVKGKMKRKITDKKKTRIYVRCTHLNNLIQDVFTVFDSNICLLDTNSYTDEQC